ncbi:hypothetical protein [Barrientosiimonas humi]|uniref:hypothetical protein n=1 Tax=Barrientosiimonas humi TaxID=999931 RepID=UPI00370D2C2F
MDTITLRVLQASRARAWRTWTAVAAWFVAGLLLAAWVEGWPIWTTLVASTVGCGGLCLAVALIERAHLDRQIARVAQTGTGAARRVGR